MEKKDYERLTTWQLWERLKDLVKSDLWTETRIANAVFMERLSETALFLEYVPHLKHCNKSQNWDDAHQAMADTPNYARGEDYYAALDKLEADSTTCTCGLEKLLKEWRTKE